MPACHTMADLARRQRWLVIVCDRCPRRGRLRTDRLLARYGPDVAGPVLLDLIAADCPRQITRAWYDRCGVKYGRG